MPWNGESTKSAADLASSFLSSVGQELGQASDPYDRRDGGYHREGGSRGDSQRSYGGRDDRYSERSYDREGRRSRHDRSREPREPRERRDRSRDRHHRSHRYDDRDYRKRRRSVSPRHRSSRSSSRREDDADVVPLDERKRKLHNWDVPPPHSEGMSIDEIRKLYLDPDGFRSSAPQNYQAPTAGSKPGSGSTPQTKHDRRLYVGQLPGHASERELQDFFNSAMQHIAPHERMSSVSVGNINRERNFTFVEFPTPELATTALQLDGTQFMGQRLSIRRPKDYQSTTEQATPSGYNMVADTPNKIYIGNLPLFLDESQVVQLLTPFGALRSFNLVKEADGKSKGYAFCEYEDSNATDIAINGLNDLSSLEPNGRKIHARRANEHPNGRTQQGPSILDKVPLAGIRPSDYTRVLQLIFKMAAEELEDDEEYQDIYDSIKNKCSQFGTIVDMKIPRPDRKQFDDGIGKAFIRYEDVDQVVRALEGLQDCSFSGRAIVCTCTDEQEYEADDLY